MKKEDRLTPLARKSHRVTIEFDINVAPEFAEKVKQVVGDALFGMLGYPGQVLNSVDLSFNCPAPPDKIKVGICQLN